MFALKNTLSFKKVLIVDSKNKKSKTIIVKYIYFLCKLYTVHIYAVYIVYVDYL